MTLIWKKGPFFTPALVLISVFGLNSLAHAQTTGSGPMVRSAVEDSHATEAPAERKAGPATVSDVKGTADDSKLTISEMVNSTGASGAKLTVDNVSTETAPSPQAQPTDEWQFQFTPYLWIAGVSGQAGLGNLVVDVNSGLGDSDVHLNFGFMGTFQARKNRFVILTDVQYTNLGSDRPTPGPLFSAATADFKTFILDPEVGYRLVDNPDKAAFVDVVGGIRYWHVRTDLNFSAGLLPAVSASRSRGWVDAVIGLRGKTHFSKKWFVTGKADLGGGGSKFTYQLFGGVGVQVSKSIALFGGYRALSVDYDKDNFLFDMILSGPVVGIGFRF
jgi:hypothetical protein